VGGEDYIGADMSNEMTLRDHARSAVRDEVMRCAWALFAEQGYEATTVDQVAEAAGMSRRTFFRYFSGKDDLLLDRILAAGDRIAAALRERPGEEAAWPALRAAFDEVVVPQEASADRSRALQLMLRNEHGVRAAVLERRRRWLELLAPLVAPRLPPRRATRGPDTRAVAVTASALACLEAAQDAWADHPGARLRGLLDEAMTAVAPLS
jgi:AcrR family transcriptional regulator